MGIVGQHPAIHVATIVFLEGNVEAYDAFVADVFGAGTIREIFFGSFSAVSFPVERAMLVGVTERVSFGVV